MADFVGDASLTLTWCFEDEATGWTDALLDRLASGDELVVPAHWPFEVANALVMARRRGRLKPGDPQLFLANLFALPVEIEAPESPEHLSAILALSEKWTLTVYDAAYLELAKRRHLDLATLDQDLIRAAKQEGVLLLA